MLNTEEEQIYIIGPAGTGKTFKVKEIEKKENKKILYLGPTNIIARNLSEEGITYHKFLGLKINESLLAYNKYDLDRKLLSTIERIKEIDIIYLDEISMVPSNIDTIIGNIISSYNKKANKKICYIRGGDPLQIGPVSGEPFYKGEYFSKSKKIKLTEVKRQKNPEWIKSLNEYRRGNPEEVLNNFTKLGGTFGCDLSKILNYELIITGTQQLKTGINILCHDLLIKESKENSFKGKSIKGNKIYFCKGYKISFCKNTKEYLNGEKGKITRIENTLEEIIIYIEKENGKEIVLDIEKENEEIILPFEGGYAVTSHSIQGTTVRKGKVLIFIDNKAVWSSPGCMYNALSRTIEADQIVIYCKSIEQLRTFCRIDNTALLYS